MNLYLSLHIAHFVRYVSNLCGRWRRLNEKNTNHGSYDNDAYHPHQEGLY